MGNDTTNTRTREYSTLDEYLISLPKDESDVIEQLSKMELRDDRPIEIVSELPARLISEILIAAVNRWSDISKYFDKPIRVYGWCYDDHVETYLQHIVSTRDNVWLTVLPYHLKEVINNA